MKNDHGTLGPNMTHGILEPQRLVHGFIDELLHRWLAEIAQHAPPEAAGKSLDAHETDTIDFNGLPVEQLHARITQDMGDLFVRAAFVIMIAEHADDRDRAGF